MGISLLTHARVSVLVFFCLGAWCSDGSDIFPRCGQRCLDLWEGQSSSTFFEELKSPHESANHSFSYDSALLTKEGKTKRSKVAVTYFLRTSPPSTDKRRTRFLTALRRSPTNSCHRWWWTSPRASRCWTPVWPSCRAQMAKPRSREAVVG